MPKYTVIVGNVGMVTDTTIHREALSVFKDYREQSKRGIGRAAHEPVTLMEDGEPILEYSPTEIGWLPIHE
jgi:hypothetical protein